MGSCLLDAVKRAYRGRGRRGWGARRGRGPRSAARGAPESPGGPPQSARRRRREERPVPLSLSLDTLPPWHHNRVFLMGRPPTDVRTRPGPRRLLQGQLMPDAGEGQEAQAEPAQPRGPSREPRQAGEAQEAAHREPDGEQQQRAPRQPHGKRHPHSWKSGTKGLLARKAGPDKVGCQGKASHQPTSSPAPWPLQSQLQSECPCGEQGQGCRECQPPCHAHCLSKWTPSSGPWVCERGDSEGGEGGALGGAASEGVGDGREAPPPPEPHRLPPQALAHVRVLADLQPGHPLSAHRHPWPGLATREPW